MFDEEWDTIIERFEDDPDAAFIFAEFLTILKDLVKANKKKKLRKALDTGIEMLYPHTKEYKAARCLYLHSLYGRLKPQFELTSIVKAAEKDLG